MIRIEMKDSTGKPCSVTAGLVDIIDGGCGLELTTPLKSGSIVIVRGRLGDHRTANQLKAGVRWCIRKADGTFRAGLEFPDSRWAFTRDGERPGSINADTLDYYEVLQLSPNADPETLSRVYRILAARYHPDNIETGNSEMFLRLSEAHQVLSDPEKRARYDARRRGVTSLPWTRVGQPSTRTEGERQMSPGVHGGAKLAHRSGVGGREVGEGEHFRLSAGMLCGWNAALRRL